MLRSISREESVLDATWRDVATLLDETARLALRAERAADFYPELLARVVQAADAEGAMLWRAAGAPPWFLAAACGACDVLRDQAGQFREHAQRVSGELLRAQGAQPAADQTDGVVAGPIRVPVTLAAAAGQISLALPLAAEEGIDSVLELWVADDGRPEVFHSRVNVLTAFGEIAADFVRRLHVRQLRELLQRRNAWDEAVLQVHAPSDMPGTCMAVANELCRLSASDRVSVLIWRRGRLRVAAVSGVARFDGRSAVVRALEGLAAGVAAEPASLWYAEGDPPAGPSGELLAAYLDQHPVRALGAIPLRAASDTEEESGADAGLVVCERFGCRPFDIHERAMLEQFARHAAVAVGRASELEQRPLAGVSNWLARCGWTRVSRSRVLASLAMSLLAAGLVVAAGWPVEFVVRVPGVLQPVRRREVYAPADGVVREVLVRQGEDVAAGEPLATMDSDELELEITRLFGELETARRQYQTVQAARRDAVRPSAELRWQAGQLAAEEERLKEVVRTLERQHQRRLEQRQELTIRAPLAGQVLTWEVDRLLRSRPLQQGQRLMTIAQVDGPWSLELRLADADVGHVLAARRQLREDLPVVYRLASDPAREYRARLATVAEWTDPHDAEGPSVQMTAALDDVAGRALRPGTTVSARISLGRQARLYVWFRDLWDFLRLRVWF